MIEWTTMKYLKSLPLMRLCTGELGINRAKLANVKKKTAEMRLSNVVNECMTTHSWNQTAANRFLTKGTLIMTQQPFSQFKEIVNHKNIAKVS